MLDTVWNGTSRNCRVPFGSAAMQPMASPELALLSRQTHALEYIATQFGLLTTRLACASEVSAELQSQYELATRRLLDETV